MTKSLRHPGAVAGALTLAAAFVSAALAPVLAAHDPETRFDNLLNAPPTIVHVVGADGHLRPPFIHPWVRVNQLEQRYEAGEDEIALTGFDGGHLLRSSDERRAPFLLLGSDSFGRDVFSRVMFGARLSLGLSLASTLAAICLGAVVGGMAGYMGGVGDSMLMRVTDFVIVLPAMYVMLALRSALPLIMTTRAVFEILLVIFAVLGAPIVAKGVRAILRIEREQEYVVAAASLGAGPVRLFFRHLLPSAGGFMIVQATILVPAFIVAEATLSFVGLGFPDPVPSWGTMLHEASNLRVLSDFPWLLSPAVVMFVIVLSLNVIFDRDSMRALARVHLTGIDRI